MRMCILTVFKQFSKLSPSQLKHVPAFFSPLVVRTFPTHQLFMGATAASRSLLHVLASYSLYNPAVGYCQGMAYVTALLLMNMEEEVHVVCTHSYMHNDLP